MTDDPDFPPLASGPLPTAPPMGRWITPAHWYNRKSGRKRKTLDGDWFDTPPPHVMVHGRITLDTITVGSDQIDIGPVTLSAGVYRVELDGASLRFVRVTTDVPS